MEVTPPPGYPTHRGHYYTRVLHQKAEGPTDPALVSLPAPYVVVITGAGRGIGVSLTRAYAQAGATGLVLASRTRSQLDKLRAEISKTHPSTSILTQACDVCSPKEVQDLVAQTKRTFGRLDLLINNAGTIPVLVLDADGTTQRGARGLVEGAMDDFQRVLQVNLHSVCIVTKAFLPLLLETVNGAKTIVTMASEAAHSFKSDLTPICYSLSKLGVIRLMESVHEAHSGEGIITHAVHPGAIPTEATDGLPPKWVASKCLELRLAAVDVSVLCELLTSSSPER